LRRWWRVLRRSLRCFFFAMRLRRFLMTEPIETSLKIVSAARAAAEGPKSLGVVYLIHPRAPTAGLG
jgi:hypothetical protein